MSDQPPPGDHAIGVGMGGSCPECRAPVDLGQQFCLECGAPIRLRKGKPANARGASPASAAAAAAMAPPAKRGFPWVPFLAVLGLITLGIVFALIDSGSGRKRSGDRVGNTTEGGITDLTNSSTTDSFPTTPTTLTATVPTCPTVTPAPAAPITPTASPTIPTVPASSSVTPITPVTTPTDSGTTTTITVDQAGNLCPATNVTTTPTTPTLTDDATTPTTGTGSGGGGLQWPSGTSGYTVVLASFPQTTYRRDDAEERAVQAQQDGLEAGVLDSNDFSSMTPNLWVVFSGVFDKQSEAVEHTDEARSAGYQGAYAKQVTPG